MTSDFPIFRRSRFHVTLFLSVLLWMFAGPLCGAEEAEDDDDELRNGLVAHYRDELGNEFSRAEKAIVVASGGAIPDRRLTSAKFTVRWEGLLSPPDSGTFRFYAHVAGRVRLKLRDRVLLDTTKEHLGWVESPPVELEFDYLPLEVTYECQTAEAKFALFWSGPKFPLEPVSPRNLYFEPKKSPDKNFAKGEQLVRGLRCSACHTIPGEPATLAVPALDHLAANVREPWLVNWLTTSPASQVPVVSEKMTRRMPHFTFTNHEAQALAAYLLSQRPAAMGSTSSPSGNSDKGKQLFLTLGCLACHKQGEHGATGLFVGGDLTRVADKRPAAFFENWLRDPVALNRRHRMPVFELSNEELKNLAAYLATCGAGTQSRNELAVEQAADRSGETNAKIELGQAMFFQHRCDACHEPSTPMKEKKSLAAVRIPLRADSNWEAGCVAEPPKSPVTSVKNSQDRLREVHPYYRLTAVDVAAVRSFLTTVDRQPNRTAQAVMGRQFLVERNCVACHARDDSSGLAPKILMLIGDHPELATQVPAMTPPALLSVGDKLRDEALIASIRRTQPVHRPWLKVRMPKFALADEELHSLVNYLVASDRIADDAPVKRSFVFVPEPALHAAGSRLVTVDGFGCTSCHQVGNVKPVNAPQNARGPDISQLGQRIRLPWFDRWVRNPARIVPGMEMPSVQLAVRGVLDENINRQLAAVWQVLNTPGFEPPEPNPVQVLRLSGVQEQNERAEIVADVVRVAERTLVSPLLIGLPNRHSVLFDLERNQLLRWAIGDVARLRTKGKSWFWEAAGTELWRLADERSEMELRTANAAIAPQVTGQFPTEVDEWRHVDRGLQFRHRLQFQLEKPFSTVTVLVRQRFTPLFGTSDAHNSGFRRELTFQNVPVGLSMAVRVLENSEATASRSTADRRAWTLGEAKRVTIESPGAVVRDDGTITLSAEKEEEMTLALHYRTDLPVDQYLPAPLPPAPILNSALNVVPGFEGVRLPLPEAQMPTALAWQPDGKLLIASLKGRVWRAIDANGDGVEDAYQPVSDELSVPYGLATGKNYIDVLTKFALLRLYDDDGDGRADRTENVASGWGHTDDYHDWVIGLPRDKVGNYFVGIPCQQDKRTAAAARWRGTVQRLSPREPTLNDPRRFSLETMTAGHRFPMGLALDRQGELFVTDNQGNYNPFNELNHARRGAHFGFINAIDKKNEKHPPVTPAAVELPHPWTRSVNGICFLNTPPAAREKLGRNVFGPFEGHLVGCEYDTRRLIRLSLQPIGDTFQGAAYPLSSDKPTDGAAFLGPLCCEVSPNGDLYVGSIRDSGWGGGNNIGEVVRLRFQDKTLPVGIAEVRAVRGGFEFEFTWPVDAARAADITNFAVTSYRRVSTPAYGGPDQDRRTDRVVSAQVSSDARRVNVQIAEMREGFVYELKTKNLASGKQFFFPAEAYFTLRKVP